MDVSTFHKMLRFCADTYGDRSAVLYQDEEYSYNQLATAVEVCAETLKERGVKQGLHVALWGYNSAQWLICFFGIIRAGGIPVLFNYSLTTEELALMFRYTDIRFIAYGNNREVKRNPTAALQLAESLGISQAAVFDIRSMDYKFASQHMREGDFIPDDRDDAKRTSDFFLFTTGTTGRSKAVQISQRSFLVDSIEIGKALPEMERRHTRFCLGSPLFHILGLEMAIGNLFFGATVYIPPEFSAATLLQLFRRNRIDFVAATGAVYMAMMGYPGFERNAAYLPRYALAGGGTVTPTQFERLETVFGHTVFLNDYGQTEIGSTLTRIYPGDDKEKRLNSVGRPFQHKSVAIMAPNGQLLPAGGQGEVVVRDDGNLMLGYYELPTEQAVDENGWLHTGDLGFFDDDGFLYLNGRIKDIIIKGGENISPREVEVALSRCEKVSEVKVFGAPHPIWGESIEACIVPADGSIVTEQELKSFLSGLIAPFKIPSHFFYYDAFPINANGKLNQQALKVSMLEKLEQERS